MKKNLLYFSAAVCLPVLMASSGHAAVILNGAATYPSGAVVDTNVGSGNSELDVRLNRNLTQTFTLNSAIQIDSIVIGYQAANTTVNSTVTLRIFEVADVNATTLTPVGSNILDVSFLLDSAARTAANFTTSTTVTSSLQFDLTGTDQVFLPALTGTAGYAFQILGSNSANGPFTWVGSTSSTYAGGRGYGVGVTAPADFSLAIVAVPEPSVFAMALGGLVAVGMNRRRNGIKERE